MERFNKIKVVFIGGSARSGSTILDRVLGNVNGFFSVGELRLIWKEGIAHNYRCGCGKPFHSCSFWSAVIDEVFGGFKNVNTSPLLDLWRFVDRTRNIPRLAFPSLQSPTFRSAYTEYIDILTQLYRAIHRYAEGKIIVDSSKALSHLLLINSIKEIDLKVIHLVRDSRAVAFSMQRKKRNPASSRKEDLYMGRQGVLASARDWSVANGLISLFARSFQYYTLLKYEDFVNQPQEALHRVLVALNLLSPEIDFFVDEQTISLAPNHMVSGNPIRFHQGEVELRPDIAWKREMPLPRRLALTALTWPLLLKYGYWGGGHAHFSDSSNSGSHK